MFKTFSTAYVTVVVCLALSICTAAPTAAAQKWIELRSPHFLLNGNVSDGDLRDVARHLEEFREALSALFPKARFSLTPTVVLVFPNERDYSPFTPRYAGKRVEVAGFFQPGQDVNYVTMMLTRDDSVYETIFHEYAHLFLDSNRGDEMPLWFGEGVADYYSTFKVSSDGVHANVGKMVNDHVLLLRERWVPLNEVLATRHDSPLYNNSKDREVFYAESWALVHYLLLGQPARTPQLFDFINRVTSGTTPDKAFQEAFAVSVKDMEKELNAYVQRPAFPSRVVTLKQPIKEQITAASRAVDEGAVEARLGDLLMNMNRQDEAEPRLQNALRLAPNQALALLSLGEMRLRQNKNAEGLEYLQRAVTSAPGNYDAQVAYGRALLRRVSTEPTNEAIEKAKRAYSTALELQPDSPSAMAGIGWCYLFAHNQMDEAQRMVERAVQLDPTEPDYAALLAQIYANQKKFAAARNVLGPLMASTRPTIKEQARQLMTKLTEYERLVASTEKRQEEARATAAASRSEQVQQPMEDGKTYIVSRRPPQEGELQVFGTLEAIECTQKGIFFVVKTADRTLRLRTTKPESVMLFTLREDIPGPLSCGNRKPADPVNATYRPAPPKTVGFDGEAVAFEIMPVGYVPKATK